MRHVLYVPRVVRLEPIQLPSEVDMMYKNTEIDRTPTGYWSAMVLTSDAMGEYYRPLMADTLHGLKGLIRDVLAGVR